MAYEMLPYLLNRVTARANQLWIKHLRSHGLTTGRWQVLGVLTRFDGSRVGTIADLSGGEQAAVSRVIDQMERDGLVTRRPSLTDSRAVEVWITGRGSETYTALLPAAEEFVERMLKDFSAAEIDTMTTMLDKLFRSLKEGPHT